MVAEGLARRDLLERAEPLAPRLLGSILRCGDRAGVIVEVEAYEGADDPASHAFGGPTDRNRVMFGPPGRLYVYRSYGIHWCANIVCGPPGVASAVLIRGVEPSDGIGSMWADRPKARATTDLASGPGKLCAALGITGDHGGVDLFDPASAVLLQAGPAEGSSVPWSPIEADLVVRGPRIGISRAVERPWRFAVAGNRHVSRPYPRLVGSSDRR